MKVILKKEKKKKKKKVKEDIKLNPNMENIRVLFFLILMFLIFI